MDMWVSCCVDGLEVRLAQMSVIWPPALSLVWVFMVAPAGGWVGVRRAQMLVSWPPALSWVLDFMGVSGLGWAASVR